MTKPQPRSSLLATDPTDQGRLDHDAVPRRSDAVERKTRTRRFRWAWIIGLGLAAGSEAFGGGPGSVPPVVLYSTGFEPEEGYATPEDGLALWEQGMGWTVEGSGGSGVVTNFFEGYGQQAYIGYTPPVFKHEFLSVWRPLSVGAPPVGRPVMKFSVFMQIVDSTAENGRYDDFRWSAYNTEGYRLFSLDFDNSRAEIFYLLDQQAEFQSTGFFFDNNVIYLLEVYMNFERNNWMALMNGQVVVDSQPLATQASTLLDLSDLDAVWALREKGKAGDNYLLFDEYQITAESTPSIPPVLELVGRQANGEFHLILHGERDMPYAIEVANAHFTEWYPLATNAPANGYWYFVDETARDYASSVYRARQVGP